LYTEHPAAGRTFSYQERQAKATGVIIDWGLTRCGFAADTG